MRKISKKRAKAIALTFIIMLIAGLFTILIKGIIDFCTNNLNWISKVMFFFIVGFGSCFNCICNN